MSDQSAIEWTDTTWNPTTGCDRVSAGCDHCYAMTLAKRLKAMGSAKYQTDGDPRTSGPGFGVAMHYDALDAPLRWSKPRKVFVNSMSDLFHDKVTDEFIAMVFAVMAVAQHHTFQVLTKRHARMRHLLLQASFLDTVAERVQIQDGLYSRALVGWPLPNVWLGVSVENQKWADIRIPALRETPAAVRWLSCEPLLGPVDLNPWRNPGAPADRRAPADSRIDWVVVGGESGPGARPMHPDWARTLRDQCAKASVPFLFKQWGEYGPLAPLKNGVFDWDRGVIMANDGTVYGKGDLDYPDGPRYGEAIRAGHDRANLSSMYRVGKKANGRELDGRTWDEYPAVPS